MTNSHEREIILSLFESDDWVDLFSIHEKYLLSPAQIVSVISELSDSQFCEVDGTKARITNSGVRWVLRNRKQIFAASERPWVEAVSKDIEQLEPGQPYMPRLRSVDKSYFEKLG